jgi:DegV family protein with EDD domain
MAIKIVTDSTADLSPAVCEQLGITVVPAIVRFGDEEFRDGVDITPSEFFKRLVVSAVHPQTSQPSPADFAKAFHRAAITASGIISINVSSKLTGIYNSAVQGKALANEKCPIEVVDSTFVSVGLGHIVLAAAKAAKAGATLNEVLSEARKAISGTKMVALLDTVAYLVKGGRVNIIKGAASKLLGLKPILTINNGEIIQSGLVRTYSQGINRIADFVKNQKDIVSLAIAHSGVPHRVTELKEKLADIVRPDSIDIIELGPALGVHGGPGVIAIAVQV